MGITGLTTTTDETRRKEGKGESVMAENQNLPIGNTPLGSAYEMISAFCVMSEGQQVHATLWAAASRIFRMFPAFPRLDFSAEQPGCGKSVSLEVAIALCPNPLTVAYSTEASIKNWLDEHPETTLGLDERDGLFGTMGRNVSRKELIAILNAGYAQNGKVLSTRNGHAVMTPVYNAIAHAGIGRAYEALLDRSITINLRKAQPEISWTSVLHEKTLWRIGDSLGEWLSDSDSQEFLEAQPKIADIAGDPRHKLIMAPLAAVARLAGCHDQFLAAENEVITGIRSHPLPSRSEMLLRDLAMALELDSGRTPAILLSLQDIRGLLRDNGGDLWEAIEPGPLGDIELRGLLREQGLETKTSGSIRGYRTDEIAHCSDRHGYSNTDSNIGQRTADSDTSPATDPAGTEAGKELASLIESFSKIGETPEKETTITTETEGR